MRLSSPWAVIRLSGQTYPTYIAAWSVIGSFVVSGMIGIGFGLYPAIMAARMNPIEAVGFGAAQLGDTIRVTVWVISKLRLDSFSGPVGVYGVANEVTGQTMKQVEVPLWERIQATAFNLVSLIATLSIGIGFFNLLPVPMLDGGAAVMAVIEGLRRKPIPERVQSLALFTGLACILLFAVVVTWNDILKIGQG